MLLADVIPVDSYLLLLLLLQLLLLLFPLYFILFYFYFIISSSSRLYQPALSPHHRCPLRPDPPRRPAPASRLTKHPESRLIRRKPANQMLPPLHCAKRRDVEREKALRSG
jgi:hypothetical protein